MTNTKGERIQMGEVRVTKGTETKTGRQKVNTKPLECRGARKLAPEPLSSETFQSFLCVLFCSLFWQRHISDKVLNRLRLEIETSVESGILRDYLNPVCLDTT